ncbi:basic-leucine zipper (bZIP) transcription factor [Ophiocordyceps camponoti-floridani]|uniref:Basic-leucine zipper (BZIP) transcription factor n=1 Tax=Ophiocordyceps camponoti-floridani TaxID=2030778 RepID=A0A8H4VAH1_9HYPO|nr:basic-leucine zipper (bZIP) transcription factor [Ophiocordyceps camponoti-floridani]
MSQRGVPPHPASRRSSGSPAKDEERWSRQHVSLSSGGGGGDARGGAAGMALAEAPGRTQQHLLSRTLGVHNILNPASEGLGPLSPRRREGEPMPAGQPSLPLFGGARPFFPAAQTGGLVSHPAGSNTLVPLGRPSTAGRDYPFSAPSTSRETSSPKLPRAPGSSQQHSEGEMRVPALASASSPAKRPYDMDGPEEARPRSGHHQAPPGRGMGAIPPLATSPRAPAAATLGRPHSLHIPRHLPAAASPSRPLSVLPGGGGGGGGDNPTAWSEVYMRTGIGGGGEGQQAYMALPGSAHIPVQVDFSQASKKADEKRQRNAKASTRHRRKRKMQQEDKDRQLQVLKDERQQQREDMDDLRRQRDFYREDRNRLRDLVARTPGIQHHAQGPPSPSTRSPASQPERSPGQQSDVATPTQDYASDPSSADRPVQRRRTDEFTGAALAPLGGGTPAYGAPQRPASASAGSVDTLPPLRAMEGAPQGAPQGAQEQDPRTGQWRPVQSRNFEARWATAGRRGGFEGAGSQGNGQGNSQWP